MTIGDLIFHIPKVNKIFILKFFVSFFFKFNWREYIIEGIFSEIKNVSINETESIIVDDFEYLSFISEFINQADISYKKR